MKKINNSSIQSGQKPPLQPNKIQMKTKQKRKQESQTDLFNPSAGKFLYFIYFTNFFQSLCRSLFLSPSAYVRLLTYYSYII